MSSTVKVFKNVISLLSERLVVPLVNLLLVVFIARFLGAEGLGRYSFIVGFVSFFDILLDLGMNTLIIREVARDRSRLDAYVSKAFTLKLAVAPLVLLSVFVFLGSFPYPPEVAFSFFVFAGASILISFSDTFNALYKAYERMNLVALMVFLRQSSLVALILVLLRLGYGIPGIAAAYAVVASVYLAVNYLLFNLKVSRVRPGVDRAFYRDLFNNSIPFIPLGFFLVIFFRMDVVLVSVLKDDAQAGLFSASSKIVASLFLLSAAFLETVFPIISRFEKGSAERMGQAVKKAFHLLCLVSFPMAAGLAVVGGDLMRMMYGKGFGEAEPMLLPLALMLPVMYLSSALHYVLIARDRQRSGFFGILALSGVLALADFMLIGKYGGLGAALATLGVSVATFVFLGVLVYKDLGDWSFFGEIPRPLLASILMGFLIHWSGGMALAWRVALGASSYATFVLVMRGVNSQDLDHARDLWAHFVPSSGRGKP